MSEDTVWQSVLGEIELTISKASFATWFKNTSLVETGPEKSIILVPNIFAKQQLESKFSEQILEILDNNGASSKQVEFIIGESNKTKPREPVFVEPKHIEKIDETAATSGPKQTSVLALNDRYQFDNFVVGPSNELAYTACLTVAKSPGAKYNPLFIYGGVGLGKTHLIQAIGNTIGKQNPDFNIIYIATETFVKEFMDQIRFKKKGFTDKYRKADVLIIDDIQFIAGKEKTQEEFFHTFNTLHQANKQIIITSDVPPKAIPTIDDRLRTRFEGGMAIDIQAPDFETRYAIVEEKANQHGVQLDKETIEYLADMIQTNVRELEGTLNQLIAHSEMRGITPNKTLAASVVGSRFSRPKHLSPKAVVEKTAKHFQVDLKEVMGPKRDKDIVLPRQVAMYLLRSELHLSFPKVAKALGRKDHTTAMHSVEKIQKGINIDPYIREQVNMVKELLYV